jgi:hypothetical protein
MTIFNTNIESSTFIMVKEFLASEVCFLHGVIAADYAKQKNKRAISRPLLICA